MGYLLTDWPGKVGTEETEERVWMEMGKTGDGSAQLYLQLNGAPGQPGLFTALIGHIWRHYFHI